MNQLSVGESVPPLALNKQLKKHSILTHYNKEAAFCHLKMLKAADTLLPYNPTVLVLVHLWDHQDAF